MYYFIFINFDDDWFFWNMVFEYDCFFFYYFKMVNNMVKEICKVYEVFFELFFVVIYFGKFEEIVNEMNYLFGFILCYFKEMWSDFFIFLCVVV